MIQDPTNGLSAPTRRSFVQAAVAAAGAAAASAVRPRPAAAEPTISKAAVAYQDEPEGDKECAKCKNFVAPSACTVVTGTISPHGFCRAFVAAG